MSVSARPFGRTEEGPARCFTIGRIDGGALSIDVTDLGASLVAARAPDRHGRIADVALGFDGAGEYLGSAACLGGSVGRFANRIGGARFALDGAIWQLEDNTGDGVHLHGGGRGFHRRLWAAETLADGVRFSLESAHLDGGYPGRLEAAATYRLAGDTLTITYEARCDRPTVCNLVNHAYWNLAGHAAGSVADHTLTVDASHSLATSAKLVPTGHLEPVAGTALDFRAGRSLADGLEAFEHSYDHTLVLDGDRTGPEAVLSHPPTGRSLSVKTDAPALQLYMSAHLAGGPPGKGGVTYGRFDAVCLETQAFPDAPNQPAFPSARLDPNQLYRHRTWLTFGVDGSPITRPAAPGSPAGR